MENYTLSVTRVVGFSKLLADVGFWFSSAGLIGDGAVIATNAAMEAESNVCEQKHIDLDHVCANVYGRV